MSARTAPEEWILDLLDENATGRLARDLAYVLRPGDFVALSGDLGAGKTTLARALIRRLSGDDTLEVPSPTFTLLQTYETPRGIVVHIDLYRIEDVRELEELGWDEAGEGAIVLVEWPDRAGDLLPPDRLDIVLVAQEAAGPTARSVALQGHGEMRARLARLRDTAGFLDGSGWGDANRVNIKGDASTRAYERLVRAGRSAILMDAPRRPDGPPVHRGKPYSAVARLAEDVVPFVAIDGGLRGLGLSAPEIYAADLSHGLLLLEDLGSAGVAEGGKPVPERYGLAVEVLARLHGAPLPSELPVGSGLYHIPPYDEEAFLIETGLLLDWYLPYVTGQTVSEEQRGRFAALWREAIGIVREGPATWTLRDYHSPNLMWLPDREGPAAIGLLDFQDAVMGPRAYDLVSLLQDARLDVDEQLEIQLLRRYLEIRSRTEPDLDLPAFLRSYAILGAQRATKILGIFVRLARRDGKPDYLAHLPRLRRYLDRDLDHPALAELSGWYKDAFAVGPRES